MKKLLLVFVAALTIASCSTDENQTNFYYKYLPTNEADVPQQMQLGETYEIPIKYTQPNSCYYFDSIYYDATIEEIEDTEGNLIRTEVRTVAIVNKVLDKTELECELSNDDEDGDLTQEAEAFLTFEPRTTGPFLFKFWAGEDENEEGIYLEYTVEIE